MEHLYFLEIAEIFFVATVIGLILNRFKQPAILAYILTGVILGPGMLGFISNVELINYISELGVIALLFTLGLEFSFEKFKQVQKFAIYSGAGQIIVTIAVVAITAICFGLNTVQSLLIGSVVALSSTVIVAKSLTDSGNMDSLHGRIIMGILVIQDLSLIPIMIILPSLTLSSDKILIPLLIALLKAGIFLAIAVFASFKIAPAIMNLIASANKELIIMSAGAISLGTAIIATNFGISLALGAFIAGLALSITLQSKQLTAEVIPFRDLFAMAFFVSIGLLMDFKYFLSHLTLIFAVVVVIIVIKFIITFAVVYITNKSGQLALWAGLSLLQIGEFSFVLAKFGDDNNIISKDLYSLIILSTLITMFISPLIIKMIPKILMLVQDNNLWNKHLKGKTIVETKPEEMEDHVIICGCGPIGKGLAKVLKLQSIPFVVIELNNKTVKDLIERQYSVIFGDATNMEILHHAGIEKAKMLVLTLPDLTSNELAIANAKKINPNVFIITRCKFKYNLDALYNIGADIVIYEEFETSVAIIEKALLKLGFTREQIESTVQILKDNKCKLMQDLYSIQDFTQGNVSLFKDIEIDWFRITDTSPILNKTIAQSNIRQQTGASIFSIVKNGKNIPNPGPDTMLENNDVLILLGTKENISKLNEL